MSALVDFNEITWRYIPQDIALQSMIVFKRIFYSLSQTNLYRGL
jgi:hypothetical protein